MKKLVRGFAAFLAFGIVVCCGAASVCAETVSAGRIDIMSITFPEHYDAISYYSMDSSLLEKHGLDRTETDDFMVNNYIEIMAINNRTGNRIYVLSHYDWNGTSIQDLMPPHADYYDVEGIIDGIRMQLGSGTEVSYKSIGGRWFIQYDYQEDSSRRYRTIHDYTNIYISVAVMEGGSAQEDDIRSLEEVVGSIEFGDVPDDELVLLGVLIFIIVIGFIIVLVTVLVAVFAVRSAKKNGSNVPPYPPYPPPYSPPGYGFPMYPGYPPGYQMPQQYPCNPAVPRDVSGGGENGNEEPAERGE